MEVLNATFHFLQEKTKKLWQRASLIASAFVKYYSSKWEYAAIIHGSDTFKQIMENAHLVHALT